jgi:dCTP deaminase
MKKFFSSHNSIAEFSLYCLEKINFVYRHIINLETKSTQSDIFRIKKGNYIICTKKLFELLIDILDESKSSMQYDENITIKKLKELLVSILYFYKELSILPQYDAPIEIYRFLRIFDKNGIASLDEVKIKFVLYPGSNVEDLTIYESTPLQNFEKNVLSPYFQKIENSVTGVDLQKDIEAYHIGIPREETDSPLYWPLLAHEVAHQVMAKKLFNEYKINAAFANFLGKDDENKFDPAFTDLIALFPSKKDEELNPDTVLTHWLTECWCDIYGYFATGPAFIFAQRNLLFSKYFQRNDIGTVTHPPGYLRLLILQIIASNYQDTFSYETEDSYDALDNWLANFIVTDNSDIITKIHSVAQWFIDFFYDLFKLQDADTQELNAHIIKLKQQLSAFNLSSLRPLIERLNSGYPIPSARICKKTLKERETTVYEIMMAAWITHDGSLAQEILSTLSSKFDTYRQVNTDKKWQLFEQELAPIYERFTQAILRSLQISEWVWLLKGEDDNTKIDTDDEISPDGNNVIHVSHPSILVDKEIRELLSSEKLKVLPLINIGAQLGSTSLDVRLGTTFQTYQPNQSGIVDFINEASVLEVYSNSRIIDLDYKESIVLAPGQFVLAHTMEYIGLPENLAAQLEGRSSFARLGIQVHMTASFIDPGFHGALTFEIYNAGPNPIRLFPGYRIGQLRFFPCEKPNKPYNIKKNAKYKGLLGHTSSLLGSDYEIKYLAMELIKDSC